MKVSHATHPSPDELTAYLVGRLNAVDSDDIREHLAACESCCDLLDTLPANDTIVAALRQQDAETSVSPDECSGSIIAPTVAPETQVETQALRSATTEIHGLDEADLKLPLELREHARYRIIKLLGRGGMGDVYQAEHKVMNRQVALKVIKPQLVQNDAAVRRFRREVQAAARLHHPNIVAAYDAEQAGDLHYLVMEFVDGTNLNQVIRQRGALPVEEACEYIRQVAEGLQYAHELGMVHRDVKPHNLMLVNRRESTIERLVSESDNGSSHFQPWTQDSLLTVKILDFGLANFANETAAEEVESHDPEYPIEPAERPHPLTQWGTMMGTPDYIAPEQAVDAHRADIRSDIYSLGCTFYMLLTGQTPFGKRSVVETVKAHTEQNAPPLSDFRNDVPEDVATILKKMMAKDPAERFQTPSEVVIALEQRRPQKPKPQPQPAPKPSIRRRGPRFLVMTLLMAFFFAAVAAIVVVTDRGRLEIHSEADDVQVVIRENGQEVRTIDLTTGSQVTWLPSGKYELELVGSDNDVVLNAHGFKMSRLGKVVVTAHWNSADRGVIRSFDGSDSLIAKNGIEVIDRRDPASGWKITADQSRTVQLFEVPMPSMKPGRFFYRAKLKTVDISGRAFLEMWVRVPGSGESFSKGFHNAVSGTNGWAEYEIPFYLRAGEQPDLVKLNVTVEGGGTVWIKDVELRGRTVDSLPENVSPEQVDDPTVVRLHDLFDNLFSEPEFKQTLHTTLSSAAGIPNDQWEKLAADPSGSTDAVQGEPLSLLLMKLNPIEAAKENVDAAKDFRYLTDGIPKPTELAKAMSISSSHGYVSAIQQEYIKHTPKDLVDGTLFGSVEFEAPDLYAGKVHFVIEIKGKRMQVIEFTLPHYGVTIRRGEDGIWNRQGKLLVSPPEQ